MIDWDKHESWEDVSYSFFKPLSSRLKRKNKQGYLHWNIQNGTVQGPEVSTALSKMVVLDTSRVSLLIYVTLYLQLVVRKAIKFEKTFLSNETL